MISAARSAGGGAVHGCDRFVQRIVRRISGFNRLPEFI
jgi:hypothetical protein